jgi:indoleamine 2,3-dioxygenase
MNQDCWQISPHHGFLIHPNPLIRLSDINEMRDIPREALEQLEQISAELPVLLQRGKIRAVLEALPFYDMSALGNIEDFRMVERLIQIYGYFASAFVYATSERPEHRIPPGIAKPLYQLSQIVERPPVLTYASCVLANWTQVEPDTPLGIDNLELIQTYLDIPDERWFMLIHADIEARAAGALRGIREGIKAAAEHDTSTLEYALEEIAESVSQMMKSFGRMPEGCNSEIYYHRVRPHIFGFTDVIYEGVEAFNGKPQTFRGQSGAQSSIIPALVAGLGL